MLVLFRYALLSIVASLVLADQAIANRCLINLYEDSYVADVIENPAFTGDQETTEVRSVTRCGKSTSFLDTYNDRGNIVELKFGTSIRHFLPLALYRKNKNHKCNRIKVRTACFTLKKVNDDSYSVTLFDRDTESKGSFEFTVNSKGRVEGLHPEFALVRASQRTRRGKIILAATQIRSQVSKFRRTMRSCKIHSSSSRCIAALEAVAENWALERLRAERFPRTLSAGEINDDWQQFREKQGHLSKIERLIDEMMRRNEAGSTSPYEVSDATKGGSGLSFGVRQLDIGANKTAKEIFQANLAESKPNWKSAHQKSKNFIFSKKILAPIRSFSPDELYFLHLEVPQITGVMRSQQARARYDDEHSRYLAEEADVFSRLRRKCGFRERAELALFAIDRRNQTGNSRTIEQVVKNGCNAGQPLNDIVESAVASFKEYKGRAKAIMKILRELGPL